MASNGLDVVGSLCARDYKGVSSQYVDEGKVIAVLTSNTNANGSNVSEEGVAYTIGTRSEQAVAYQHGLGDDGCNEEGRRDV